MSLYNFWLTSEDLPDPDNRVKLTREGGIMLNYTPNNVQSHQRLQAKLRGLPKHIAAVHLAWEKEMSDSKFYKWPWNVGTRRTRGPQSLLPSPNRSLSASVLFLLGLLLAVGL